MNKFFLVSILAVFLFSCNKLTDKNIVGSWNVTEYKVYDVPQTIPNNTYFEFTDAGIASLFTDGVLDRTGTYSVESSGSVLIIDGINYTVDKKGKTMKLTYIGFGSEEWTLEKQ